jgi:hypothetical protein
MPRTSRTGYRSKAAAMAASEYVVVVGSLTIRLNRAMSSTDAAMSQNPL